MLPSFPGTQLDSNPLCFKKSSAFLFQTEQLCIPASDSCMTKSLLSLERSWKRILYNGSPRDGPIHPFPKARKSSGAMLAEQLCMPSCTRHGPAQSPARLLPSPPSPCEKRGIEKRPHLFACRTTTEPTGGGCYGSAEAIWEPQFVTTKAGPVLLVREPNPNQAPAGSGVLRAPTPTHHRAPNGSTDTAAPWAAAGWSRQPWDQLCAGADWHAAARDRALGKGRSPLPPYRVKAWGAADCFPRHPCPHTYRSLLTSREQSGLLKKSLYPQIHTHTNKQTYQQYIKSICLSVSL